jgi:hypothetical protein
VDDRKEDLRDDLVVDLERRAEYDAAEWPDGAHARRGPTRGTNDQRAEGGGRTDTSTQGGHQTLVPEYDQFLELANRTYYTFEEDKNVWERDIRTLPRGTVFLRLVEDNRLHTIDVKRSAPGHLGWDRAMLRQEFPEASRTCTG